MTTVRPLLAMLCLAGFAVAQTPENQPSRQTSPNNTTSPQHDIGSGAGEIGKGVAKGAGSAAKGTAKAAGDLVTLHPVDAATDLGKGAASTGKHVGTGAVKGTARVLKGTGKAFKHLF